MSWSWGGGELLMGREGAGHGEGVSYLWGGDELLMGRG